MQTATQEDSIVIGTEKITLYDHPIAEGSSFDFRSGMEKRSSSSEEERHSEGGEDRKSPDTLPSQAPSLVASVSLTSSEGLSTRSLPVVSPDRPNRDLSQSWHHEKDDDENDNMSCGSGYSYSTFNTTASSESVQDIISRLQSETDRRRRRLMRRRSRREMTEGGNSTDVLKKYNTSSSDPKLGFMVEIKE